MTLLDYVQSSSLYKISNRKDKICSAITNPVNVELVQQLSDAIDVESLPVNYTTKTSSDKADKKESNESIRPSKGGANFSGPSHFSSMSEEEFFKDDTDDLGDVPENSSESTSNTSTDNTIEPEEVKESMEISKEKVNSATTLYNYKGPAPIDLVQECEVIIGTLNSRDDTAGVTRSSIKDNELWIYYNDSINLNNVMSQVITVISGAGYSYLEFNRLARSDNAVVFEISQDVIVNKEDSDEN